MKTNKTKVLTNGERLPLFGTVSHDGCLFMVHYHKTEREAGICLQGYSPQVFKGLAIPIIRFDKSELKNVLECIKGEVAEIAEYYHMPSNQWARPVALKDYLNDIKKKGVPVETGYH